MTDDEPHVVTPPQYVRLGAVLLAVERATTLDEARRAIHALPIETLAQVRAEERERAARVAERLDGLPETYHAPVFRHLIADAIRAGGKP